MLGLKKAIFGDLYYQKFSLIENENEELKFRIKILELQLGTLKKKNEEVFNEERLTRIKSFITQLEVEFFELSNAQQKVVSRLGNIFELLKNVNFYMS